MSSSSSLSSRIIASCRRRLTTSNKQHGAASIYKRYHKAAPALPALHSPHVHSSVCLPYMRFDQRTTNLPSTGAQFSTQNPSPRAGIDARSAVSCNTKVFEASLDGRRERQGVMSAVLDIAAVELRHVRTRNTVFCRPKFHLVFVSVARRMVWRNARFEKSCSCGRVWSMISIGEVWSSFWFAKLSNSSQVLLVR